MSLNACIDELAAAGQMTPAQAAEARRVYGEVAGRRRQSMGPAAAEALATDEALIAMEVQAAQVRRQTLLQVDAQRRILGDLARFQGDDKGAASMALLDHDQRAPYAGGNVAVQKQAIVGRAHAMIGDLLNKFRRDLVGNMKNPAEMREVVGELFGRDSGNVAARQMAEAWQAAAEALRQRFNAAGGAIGRMDRWGLPQSHDGLAIREAGFDAWRAFILPRLDRARMVDGVTGLPFSDAQLDDVLASVFETITTDGWSKRAAGGAGGRKLANSRAEHRFLRFADGEAWYDYHETFGGGGTPFDAMVGHIDDMARDIAHMERLGPNPTATVRWLQDGIRKDAALKGERASLTRSAEGRAEALGKLYDLTSGRLGIPVNAKWARGLSAGRAIITSAKLGSAALSAVTDTGFQAMTRLFNGLPVWGAVTDHFKLMTSADSRQAAVRLGLIAEEASRQAAGIQRYMGEAISPGVAARLADGVLRVSGLQAWTQSGKWAFGMGMLGELTDQAGLAFDALPGALRGALERYGVDEAGWDVIRASERLTASGADFIDPTSIADAQLGDRLLRMILTETNFAVPEVSARARAMMSFGRPGTFAGEVGRSMFQFKSFGVAVILNHGRRMMAMTPYGGAAYAAGLFMTTAMLGGLALQMKEISKGKTPRETDATFWRDAAMQGGGMGIFSDFLQSAVIQSIDAKTGTGRTGSLGEAIAGPMVGAVADVAKLGLVAPASDAIRSIEGEDAKNYTGREAVRAVRGYTPGGSLWWARAGFERLIIDNLQAAADPGHAESWRLMEKRAAERGQDYWWAPGDALPEGTNEGGQP